jgi:hypothetical protein
LICHRKEEYEVGILENKRRECSNGTVEDNLRSDELYNWYPSSDITVGCQINRD